MMTENIGPMAIFTGIVPLVVIVLCILLAWWCLQEFRFDQFLKRPLSSQSKLLKIILAVIVGHQFARFIFDYLEGAAGWTSMLK